MRSLSSIIIVFIFHYSGFSQLPPAYRDSLIEFRSKYVNEHEAVKGKDRDFIHFFAIKPKYRIAADFQKLSDTTIWGLYTSSSKMKKFHKYGIVSFRWGKDTIRLTLYQDKALLQNPQYANYLFLPFMDGTTGRKTYSGGRYLDLLIEDIRDGEVIIDFNKCYNPYCAYGGSWNCPIPPLNNHIPIAIKAGEKMFGKTH